METIANEVNNLIQSENTGATDFNNSTPSEVEYDTAAENYVLGLLDSNGATEKGNDGEQVNANQVDVTTDEQPEMDSGVESETNEGTDDVETDTYELPSDETVINVNGQDLSFRELKDGYMRFSDYTRKTQESSAIRKEADKAILEAKRVVETEVLSNIRKQFEVEYNFNRPTAEQWKDWQENDQFTFAEESKKWNARDEQVRQLMEYDAQSKAIAEREAQEAHEAAVSEAHTAFTGKFPEFLDASKRGPLIKDMVSTLEGMGFNHEEIATISDARHMEIVYLASQALKANKSAAVAKQVLATKPITKPAQKSTNTKPSQFPKTNKVMDEQTLISQLAARL
ncbi:hypothetical protein G6M86_20990 [Agrobacterium tumefaciens]|uniref:Scaffolding protein n=1 Tax=Agrobacterium tumefaciens TaxID=358 RepID=A0AAJ4N6K3_AGRTU|nr:hypothetical protein G6M86_20990 [Agrobacterium tumefaciens]